MITIDTSTFIALLLAAAIAGALLGILPAWRRLMTGGRDLPVWGFLRRRGAGVEGRAALQAEMRCEMCDSKAQCRLLLANGADAPVTGCPNAKLFAAPGLKAGGG